MHQLSHRRQAGETHGLQWPGRSLPTTTAFAVRACLHEEIIFQYTAGRSRFADMRAAWRATMTLAERPAADGVTSEDDICCWCPSNIRDRGKPGPSDLTRRLRNGLPPEKDAMAAELLKVLA